MVGIKKYKADIKHPVYQIYKRIKRQCFNKNAIDYCGAEFYKEWENWDSFYDWIIEQGWVKGLTIIRIDEEKGFIPDNCKLTPVGDLRKQNFDNEKARQTCLEKYGVEYPIQNKEVMDKVRKTNLEKYRSESPLGSDSVKEKIKQSKIELYGTENTSSLDWVKEKMRQTSIEKYGVDHHMKTEAGKEAVRKTFRENGIIKQYEGLDSKDWAEKIGISRSCMLQRIAEYGFEQAIQMTKVQSEIEYIIESFLKEQNINYIFNKKLGDKFPDFVLSDFNLIIETDGLYWHSDAINPDKNYHVKKRQYYLELGYNTLFFRENEIHSCLNIIKSIILNRLNRSEKIYARKCDIIEVNKKEAKEFLNRNHLMSNGQGENKALVYNGEIVEIIQYYDKYDYREISRFCSKTYTNVVGGFSRLLKQIKTQRPIVSFVDRRYGKGDYLEKLGFKLERCDPSFRWVKDNKTYHRLQYLGNSGYDYKMYKLWDCGQAKYIL